MNEEIEINVRKLRPFTRFIYTIGELPTSYLMSMTYEEQLIWLCNYLEKTVIPAINNNAQAVEELQSLFIELQEYVNNYFENLDVQEEINNKLDDMAESGELENIISQYIQLATTYVYNSVSEMKASTNLVDGSFARTSGFYSYNDGGGATYKIRTVTVSDTVDEKTLIAITETLVAELIKENEMNVRVFGAKGDGETDDTLSIQTALNFCHNIIIKDGTYMIDAEIGLLPKSNSNITLVNAILKAIPNDATHYNILLINNVSNVNISGGIIEGERSDHTGETGEWGMGINITEWSENIHISNILIKNCWGDGIYINKGKNITTQNVVCDNNRRQGISVISVDGYHSLNDKLINTNGTLPESGIDIEPNRSIDVIKNILLENLYTENNNGCGIDIYLWQLDDTSEQADIKIINHHDNGSKIGESIAHKESLRFTIITENPLLKNNNTGIDLRDCFDNEIDKVMIIRPKIINCNNDTTITTTYVCGISGYTTKDDTSAKIGGVTIIEPFITTKIVTQKRVISFYDTTYTNRCNNIDIINPINRQSNSEIAIYGDNIRFTDIYNKYKFTIDYSHIIQPAVLASAISNINQTTNRTITLTEGLPIGYEITFINEKISYRLSVQFDENDYIRYFNDVAGNLLNLNTMNALLTIKKISEHEWIVENIIGEITVAE